jgi:hypothetical protein
MDFHPDKEQFSTAVCLLRQYVELGHRLPLNYTPTERSLH